MAAPTGAIAREVPYGPLLTGPANRLIDGEESNWPFTVTADHDKYAGHHTLGECAAPEQFVMSMKVRDGVSADRKILRETATSRFMHTNRSRRAIAHTGWDRRPNDRGRFRSQANPQGGVSWCSE